MAEATELQTVNERFFHWSVYDAESKCDLNSTALILREGLVVFDPAPLAESQWKLLLAKAPLRAIVLTSGNHVRWTASLRPFKAPVVTTAATRRAIHDIKPDVILLDKELLYGLAPIPISGLDSGETVYFQAETGLLIVGDSILNISPETGLQLLPDKYCTNPKEMKESLKKLLTLEFHSMAFAHGTPLVGRAKDHLKVLLA